MNTRRKLKPKMIFWSTNTLNQANIIFRDKLSLFLMEKQSRYLQKQQPLELTTSKRKVLDFGAENPHPKLI